MYLKWKYVLVFYPSIHRQNAHPAHRVAGQRWTKGVLILHKTYSELWVIFGSTFVLHTYFGLRWTDALSPSRDASPQRSQQERRDVSGSPHRSLPHNLLHAETSHLCDNICPTYHVHIYFALPLIWTMYPCATDQDLLIFKIKLDNAAQCFYEARCTF